MTIVHTHPFFVAERDHALICNGDEVTFDEDLVIELNNSGMSFSDSDLRLAREHGVEAHLGVSDRSVVKVYRRTYRIEILE